MAPRNANNTNGDGQDGPTSPASAHGESGFATLEQLRVGVKAYVEKDGEDRLAEILSVQQRRSGLLSYYVHYEDFNKRLDEWISPSRINLEREVEWPVPEEQKKDNKKDSKNTSNQKQAAQPLKQQDVAKSQNKSLKRPRALTAERSGTSTPNSEIALGNKTSKRGQPQAGGKENRESGDVDVSVEVIDGSAQPEDEGLSIVDVQDAAAAAKASAPTFASREDEIEKLRTQGSMTQNQAEISRVRNLMKIQMGTHEIEPWYFSPYPQEFSECDIVYICEFCLEYFPEQKMFERHRRKCTLVHPPGNEIYRDDKVSFFEIDGRRQRTWCRNLCLLSKLFLDHKTLYYDVDPFLFYCMTVRDTHGCHLVGYFSKEKESGEGYNLACILTLPQYQRQGFGRLLIAFSYELSKREGKVGSPEKPLSDLGLLGYRAYWQEVIVELLLDGRNEATIEELGAQTAMTTNDVLHTLQTLNMLRFARNGHIIVLTDSIVEQRRRQRDKEAKKNRHVIEPDKLVWKPPVFTASSRTWNW